MLCLPSVVARLGQGQWYSHGAPTRPRNKNTRPAAPITPREHNRTPRMTSLWVAKILLFPVTMLAVVAVAEPTWNLLYRKFWTQPPKKHRLHQQSPPGLPGLVGVPGTPLLACVEDFFGYLMLRGQEPMSEEHYDMARQAFNVAAPLPLRSLGKVRGSLASMV